jgi:hypothetical protein
MVNHNSSLGFQCGLTTMKITRYCPTINT